VNVYGSTDTRSLLTRSVSRGACWATVSIVVALAAGCGNSIDDPSNRLAGRTFLSQSVTTSGEPVALVTGTQVRITFAENERITATAGCNILSGTVSVTNDRLVIADLGSTEMGCDQRRHAQDEWLATLLSGWPHYELAANTLTLRADDSDTVVQLLDRTVADPDRPLQKTMWSVDGIVNGGTVSSVPSGTSATVVFGVDNVHIDVEACNEGDARVTFGAKEIEIGGLTMTDVACSKEAAQLESAIFGVLHGTVDYAIEASSLRLTAPNGSGLTMKAR
jgi:heat shock protein HslJ